MGSSLGRPRAREEPHVGCVGAAEWPVESEACGLWHIPAKAPRASAWSVSCKWWVGAASYWAFPPVSKGPARSSPEGLAPSSVGSAPGTLLWASPAVRLPRPMSCFLCSWAHACGLTPVLPCFCLSLRLGCINTRSSAQSPSGLGFLGPEHAPGTGVHHLLNSHDFLEGRVLLLPFCR